MKTNNDLEFGLCENCHYAKLINNARGSQFLLCKAHKENPSMPKYPNIPVVNCPAYISKSPIEKRKFEQEK